jgi:hypothetical protein
MRFLVETQKGEKETHAEEKEKGKGRKGGGQGRKRGGRRAEGRLAAKPPFPANIYPKKFKNRLKPPKPAPPCVTDPKVAFRIANVSRDCMLQMRVRRAGRGPPV